jgi:hypothetical protein
LTFVRTPLPDRLGGFHAASQHTRIAARINSAVTARRLDGQIGVPGFEVNSKDQFWAYSFKYDGYDAIFPGFKYGGRRTDAIVREIDGRLSFHRAYGNRRVGTRSPGEDAEMPSEVVECM